MRFRRPPYRTPLYVQAQETECCIAVLGTMLAHFGRWVPLAELRAVSGISRHCLNAADIARTARHYGLSARVLRKEPGDLAQVGLPLIAHLDFIHFVVVEAIDEHEVKVNDPACGAAAIPRGVFDERFTGIAISLAPTAQFQPNGKAPALLAQARPWIGTAARRQLAQAAAAGLAQPLVLAAGALALPAIARPAHTVLAVAGGAACIAWLRWREARALARAGHAIAADGEARLADTLARQPQAFFDYRIPAALQRAAQLPVSMARAICGMQADAMRLASLPILAGTLALLHPALATAGVAALAAGGALVLRELYRHRRRLLPLLADAPPVAPGAAPNEAAQTGARQDENARFRIGSLAGETSRRQMGLPILLRANLAVRGTALLLAILFVAAASGLPPAAALALLLVLAPMARALSPVLRIPARLAALRSSLQLLDDLVAPVAPAPPAPAPAPAQAGPARRGVLAAVDVVFGYAVNRPPQLQGVSLSLAAGEVVGIGGGGGSGKSTLAAVLSGLAQPWSGSVLLDGQDLAGMTDDQRAGAVAWLPRQPYLVAGSVRANLCLWRQGVDDARLREALADACLDEVLQARGGLDANVAAHGANFSGGQRQRLSLARALVAAPQVLVLDEVTDGLDPALEAAVLARLRRRGCSVILISQRLSTLSACDRVLMLEHGQLATGNAPAAAATAAAAAAGPLWDAPTPEESPVHGAALRDCLRRLAAAARVPWQEHGPATADDGVLAIARSHGLELRLVRMSSPSWWRFDPGPLLVFHRDGGAPALLLPNEHTPGSYLLADAGGGAAPLAASPARLFREQCYAVRPRPGAPVLRAQRGQLWLAAACALASMVLAFVALHLAAQPPLAAALGMAALALGFQWQAGAVLARIGGRLQPAAGGTLDDIMARLQPGPLRQLGGARLAAASAAARELVAHACDPLRGPAWSASVFVAAAAALAVLVPQLAWLPPLLLLGAALPLARQGRRQRLRAARAANRRAMFFSGLLQHATTLRAAGRYRAGLGAWLRMAHGRRMRGAVLDGWLAAVPLLAQGVLLAWALPADGGTAPGTLAAAMVALEVAARASAALARSAQRWASQLPGRRALRALVRAPRHAAAPVPQPPLERIELRGLAFRFPGSPAAALDGVSLRLLPGRVTALAGPSGSGKSTLLRVLLGFEQAAAGAIVVNGHALDAAGLAALRAGTGLVLQDDTLEDAGPLAWQVAGGGDWPLASVREALRLAVLDEEVARMPMGLQTIVDQANLSTSQFQRLSIARCLLRRPRLLVLDEATSALPDDMQARLIGNIRRLGIACLLVSHRASALAAADEVVVLAHGKVACRGPARDPAVAAALARITGQERRYELEQAPAVAAAAPPAPAPAVRAGLFRQQALRAFQGPRTPAAPALLVRRLRWTLLLPPAVAAMALAYGFG